jgi:hypothetical protein
MSVLSWLTVNFDFKGEVLSKESGITYCNAAEPESTEMDWVLVFRDVRYVCGGRWDYSRWGQLKTVGPSWAGLLR